MKRIPRISLRVALATAGAMALMAAVAPAPAQAAPPPGYTVSTWRYGDDLVMYISNEAGIEIGWAEFQADPNGFEIPGDAIRASDRYADGLGVEAWLDINPGSTFQTDRIASTRGINSPYTTPYKTGNIAEGTRIGLRLCLVQGSLTYCSGTQYSVA
ncbi:hypothetical protein AB0J82_22735 [Asanoa sp. NPDC049518]|uniref:hypothetical protein n=1 Tax=unclassified Asanoa TaxID=2685164 RepID=UPI00343EB9C7